MSKKSNPRAVSFLLNHELHEMISDYSDKKNVSRHEIAKDIVSDHFYDERRLILIERQLLIQEKTLNSIDKNIKTVGLDLAFSMKSLMEIHGVEEEVAEKLARECSVALKWNVAKEE